MPKDQEYWFESIGYGSGLPVSWQVWGLCAAYSLANVAAALLVAERSPIGFFAIVLSATVLFLAAGVRRLRGGWGPPRSGEKE